MLRPDGSGNVDTSRYDNVICSATGFVNISAIR